MQLIWLAVVLNLTLAPLAAEAQQAGQAARIGYLAANLTVSPHMTEAFRQGLRDLGYVDGRSVVIEYRDAEGKYDRLPARAAELVALKVDVIVAADTPAALAAKQATRTLPIVFIGAGDPVTIGLVTSLARPGGNVTGLSLLAPELVGKRLELLKQAVPGVGRVAALWQPGFVGERTEKDMLKEVEVAARALGVRLQFVEVRGPADFYRAFSDMTRARADALTVLGSAMFANERRRVVDLAAKNRLPGVYGFREYVDAGGLMAYGPNVADLFQRAATYADKILKGAKPGDLPVEQPTKFELVLNLKTAKALGLTIPQSVLVRADQVIEIAHARPTRPTPAGGTRLRRASSTLIRPRCLGAPSWLDSWSGIGHVTVGMARQGYDLQLTRYDEKGWRATFYTSGMEHSPTSATDTGWERTPWHATQRAAWEALKQVEMN